MRPELLLCVGLIASASPAAAQEVRDYGTTMRGRLGRDPIATNAAQEAVDRAGVSCRVTNGVLRGRDADGATHYEVACADAPGYVVIGGPTYRAINCLAIAERGRGSGSCRLRENADTRRHYARIAASAGVDCVVQEGRITGVNPRQDFIYEIGCVGPSGYWLEPSADGWLVTDCLIVSSQGGECRLTSRREDREAFQSRLTGTELAGCHVAEVRAMGRGSNGSYFEVGCGSRENVVARFDPPDVFQEVIPCAEAGSIGGGCRRTSTP
ncbi:hypothetical protein [Brevundimonas sp. LjRoot202]|uniref:hypothetical protein n=1 Tax=Brevundimonas sp. LjRoot202 TaxID=3342281 RepID=UPI003ECDAD74